MQRKKALAFLYFNASLIVLMPLAWLVYFIWIPERLFIAGPPIIIAFFLGVLSLSLLLKGHLTLAGNLLAFFVGIVLFTAQWTKRNNDLHTAYSSFINLFFLPAIIASLFGNKRVIFPLGFLMILGNLAFYLAIHNKADAKELIAAKVGFMTTTIFLTLGTVLLYLLRFITDNAVRRIEKTSQAYSRFVPVEFLNLLQQKDIIDLQLGHNTRQEMTILFLDIRGFTSISEKMNPDENFRFINYFLGEISPIIRANDGFVDKYIGDSVMALFYSPSYAVLSAKQILERIRAMNAERPDDAPLIRIGVGINTGTVMIGAIGEEKRLENTVIGDTVNTASRIEAMNKKYMTSVLITGETLDRLREEGLEFTSQFLFRKVDKTRVRGRTSFHDIFEFLWGDDVSGKISVENLLAEAIDSLYNSDVFRAREILLACREIDPNDDVVNYHLKVCNRYFASKRHDLFHKYGRMEMLRQLVENLYEDLFSVPELAVFFRNVNMTRLKGHQIQVFSALLGGPGRINLNRFESVHRHLRISPEIFAMFLNTVEGTLRRTGIAENDIPLLKKRLAGFEELLISGEGSAAAAAV